MQGISSSESVDQHNLVLTPQTFISDSLSRAGSWSQVSDQCNAAGCSDGEDIFGSIPAASLNLNQISIFQPKKI